jgi:hypothetical protein
VKSDFRGIVISVCIRDADIFSEELIKRKKIGTLKKYPWVSWTREKRAMRDCAQATEYAGYEVYYM